ncbi:hypothetical protein HGRIS_010932 [Hohenbuehelia grisea]|uniref:SigF-like NTF2-like domain-containing protein n=1 Tax=Hohenbuehelia grisea TaxID=104357 RepID=A0ABR3IY97_9AGAR
MQNPAQEISSVVKDLTTASTADFQQSVLQRYFTHDAAFRHPLCSVEAAHGSRDKLLGIYQWYRVMSPRLQLEVKSVSENLDENTLLLDVVQTFHIFLSPFKPAPSHLLVRLTLRKENDLYYISKQEDFYHPDELAALVLPPLSPLIRLALSTAGFISNINAKLFQTLGFWQTGTGTTPAGVPPDGAESDTNELKWD